MEKETGENRIRAGKRASAVGMAINFALACAKIIMGALTGLVSVVADGVNNLSDCGSGAVSLVSFRISAKPADKEHPYGHQRAEYIASMIISMLILVLAVELFRESLEKIFAGTLSEGGWEIYLLLGISVAVKAGMFFYYRGVARRICSDALKAAATDSLCDCIATTAVAVGLAVARTAGFAADGWAGIFVACFIAWEGISILREAGSKLLGQAPDRALADKIAVFIRSGEGVLGFHDLRLYSYGPDKTFATVHIEMDADLPSASAHERIDAIERKVLSETGVLLTAHFDPVALQDGEARELEARIRAAVEGMYEGMNVHDFRMVRGTRTKVIFEVGVPFSCKTGDGEIENSVGRAVRILGDYEPVVTVERE